MYVLEIIFGVIGCIFLFAGLGFLLYLIYNDIKKSNLRAERNSDNLERIADYFSFHEVE